MRIIKIIPWLFINISWALDSYDENKAMSLSNDYVTMALKESQTNSGISITGCRQISPKEVLESFFSIDNTNIDKYPTETQRLFTFMKRLGLIVELGQINPHSLFSKTDPNAEEIKFQTEFFEALGPISAITPTNRINYIIKPGHNSAIFSDRKFGFFLRNKNNPICAVSSGFNQDPLFQTDPYIIDAFERIKKINVKIARRLNLFKEILNTSKNKKDVFIKLKSSKEKLLPEIVIEQIAALQLPDIIKRLKKANDTALNLIGERNIAIDTIYPTKIDALLLYSFYHFEESGVLTINKSKQFEILNCFGDFNHLSITNILRPFAYDALEKLSFNKKPVKKKRRAKKMPC